MKIQKMYMALVIKNYPKIVKSLQNKKNKAIQAEQSIESLKILHSLYSSIDSKKIFLPKKTNFKNKLNNA